MMSDQVFGRVASAFSSSSHKLQRTAKVWYVNVIDESLLMITRFEGQFKCHGFADYYSVCTLLRRLDSGRPIRRLIGMTLIVICMQLCQHGFLLSTASF